MAEAYPQGGIRAVWDRQYVRIGAVYLLLFLVGSSCSFVWGGGKEVEKHSGPRDEYAELRQKFEGERVGADPLDSFGVSKATHEYLAQRVGVSAFGDKVFCSYEHIGETEDGNTILVYLWVFCSEIYPAHDTLHKGGGTSHPLILKLQKQNDMFVVIEHAAPELGAGYGMSIESMFPSEYHERLFPDQYGIEKHSRSVDFLKWKAYEDAAQYYNLELE